MTEKVWFITGTSRGFGREWAIAALERGDKVAATARDTATLADLGFSQALAQEIEPFGVHVTLIEPAGFSTDWSGSSSRTAEPLPDYADLHAENEPSWRRADLLPLRVLAPHAGPGYRRQHGLVVAE